VGGLTKGTCAHRIVAKSRIHKIKVTAPRLTPQLHPPQCQPDSSHSCLWPGLEPSPRAALSRGMHCKHADCREQRGRKHCAPWQSQCARRSACPGGTACSASQTAAASSNRKPQQRPEQATHHLQSSLSVKCTHSSMLLSQLLPSANPVICPCTCLPGKHYVALQIGGT
jgi:hypothetical protein